VRDAWLAPADSGPAAVYMRLANPGGDSAVVVQALTAVSRATELHETAQMRHDGMLMEHMTPVSRFVVMPHDSLTLDRVGRHVMLLGVARSVRVGDRLDVSLVSAHGWGAGAARDTVKFVAAVR
jgi:copper(I)-binding protein